MAKNKIVIDIEVNGKMQKATVSAKKLSDALDQTGKSARTADRNLKGASQQSANGTKNFSKMAQGMTGTLVPAYATLAANVFAITALFSALKTAADFRVIQESQVAFSSATGVGLKSLTANIKSATDGLIGFADASSAAAIGTASGLNMTQIENLATGAKNVSLILGRDVTDSFNRLIRGVTKAEPELLDELGITLRLADASEKYAASLNKSAKELTLYEKSQAVALEVQTQLDQKYASTAAAVELQSNSVAKLGVEFEKVLNPIKSFVSFLAEPTAEFLANNVKALTAAFALLVIPIVKSLIPGLEDWAQTSIDSAEAASNAIRNAKTEVEALKQAQVDLAQAGTDPTKAAQTALTGIKAKKGSGIDLIQQGQFDKLSKRQITALRVAAKKGTGAVKNMSDSMRREYIAALTAMEGKTQTTGEKIKTGFSRTKESVNLSIKQIGAQWELTMARMQKFGAKASKALNTLFRFAGIFGILFLLRDMMIGALKFFGIGQQSQNILDLAENIDSVIGRLETVQKEFKKFAEVQTKFYAEQGNELPMLDQLAAVGGFIEGNVKVLNEALDVMDQFANIKAIPDELTDNLNEAVEAAKKATLPLAQRYQSRQVTKAKGEIERRDEELDPSGVMKFFTGAVNPAEKLAEAQEKVKTTALAMAAGLRAAKIQTQEGGDRFLELVDDLALTGTVAAENRDEFNKLADSLVGTGREAKLAQEGLSALTMQFDKRMSSMTTFKTSVTDIINEMESLKKTFEDLASEESDAAIKNLDKMLATLNKIKTNEIEFAREMSKINLNAELGKRIQLPGGGSVGATSLMQKELKRELDAAKANAEVRKAQAALDLAMDQDTPTDPVQIEILTNKLEQAKAAAKNLNDELNFGNRLLTTVAGTFESSMTSAIEGLITGTKSLKEAFADMARSILAAIARMIAEMIAFRIVSSIMGSFMSAPMGTPGASAAPHAYTDYSGFVRYGGVMSEGKKVAGYAVGGIARGPQAGYPALLHGTEAIVPLPNGKSIPVDMKGAGQNNNVTVNVAIDRDGNAREDSQADSNEGANLGSAIAAVVQKELLNQKRAGGILNPMGVA
tara:strand:+ start:1744 stop:4977 length:3234 start_codon:yes stop_codon:yes gene_type:complete